MEQMYFHAHSDTAQQRFNASVTTVPLSLPLEQEWNISTLCFEVDTEPYAKARDARIATMAAAQGVHLRSFVSHTLYVSCFVSAVPRDFSEIPSSATH